MHRTLQFENVRKASKRLLKESDGGVTADLETDEECGPPRENKIAPDLEMNEMSTPTAKDTQKMEKIKQVHLEQVSMLKKNKMTEKKGMQL